MNKEQDLSVQLLFDSSIEQNAQFWLCLKLEQEIDSIWPKPLTF